MEGIRLWALQCLSLNFMDASVANGFEYSQMSCSIRLCNSVAVEACAGTDRIFLMCGSHSLQGRTFLRGAFSPFHSNPINHTCMPGRPVPERDNM